MKLSSVVLPGEEVEISFVIKATSTGYYTEEFMPYISNYGYFNTNALTYTAKASVFVRTTQ